ncbi:unnamed protein product [Lactuca saligna]|uniref:Uncharacterized protein n=1 Tax=Lactuca saligna TaxID=75948 RepID=A0AA35Z2B2_LACSI|nr:unnamed protein product [Lactuca saligna]
MAIREYAICMEDTGIKIFKSLRPWKTSLVLNCLMDGHDHSETLTINWDSTNKFRFAGTLDCGERYQIDEVKPQTYKDKTLIAQIRVTGNVSCMCTRFDTTAVFKGNILGKPVMFQTNASGYWKQQKPRYAKRKLEVFLDTALPDGSKTKDEQFSGYDMDKSSSSESSASKAISFVPKSISSSDDSGDQDAFTVEKSYLAAEEPPQVAHSPSAELPARDALTDFVEAKELETGGEPLVRGLGLNFIALM